jgi:hypothetical protein
MSIEKKRGVRVRWDGVSTASHRENDGPEEEQSNPYKGGFDCSSLSMGNNQTV